MEYMGPCLYTLSVSWLASIILIVKLIPYSEKKIVGTVYILHEYIAQELKISDILI